jgi:hypothetical protein
MVDHKNENAKITQKINCLKLYDLLWVQFEIPSYYKL